MMFKDGLMNFLFQAEEDTFNKNIAFYRLKPVCDKLMVNLSNENVRGLIDVIVSTSDSEVNSLLEYIIFPIRFHIWRYSESGEKVCTGPFLEVLCCLKIIFKKLTIDDAGKFIQLNVILLQLLMKNTSDLNNNVPEEMKCSVIETICVLYEIANGCSEDILTQIYNSRIEQNVHVQVVYVCTQLARNERLIKLRIIALKCLLAVMRVQNDQHSAGMSHCAITCDQRFQIKCRVADIVAPMFPGIVSTAYSILKCDWMIHREIYVLSIRVLCRSIVLIFENISVENLDDANSRSELNWSAIHDVPSSEISGKTNCSRIRTEEWFQETANKLVDYVRCLTSLCSHPQWKVRQELVRGAALVLTKCSGYIKPIRGTLLQVLIILSRDVFEDVSREAESILKILLNPDICQNHHEILGNAEEDMICVINSLNSLVDSTDKKTLLSQLNLFYGFVNILNLKQICKSSIYVQKLFCILTKLVRFDASALNSFQEYVVQDASLPCRNKTFFVSWKNMKYLTGESENIVKNILYTIGRKIDFEYIAFYLLDEIENHSDNRKEFIYLLNNIILTDQLNCDDRCFELMETILHVYLDPVYWSLPTFGHDDSTNNTSSAFMIRNNVLQICLLAEGIGNMAVCLKKIYSPLLRHCLYSVIERAGCSNEFVSAAAEGALKKITEACGYSDMTELITKNIDYVTHFMDMKLRNIENCPEIFDVFCVIVKYSQETTLPIICDIIEILLTSEKITDDDYCEGFLRVFQMFVRKLRSWFTPVFNDVNFNEESDEKLRKLLYILDEFYYTKRKRKMNISSTNIIKDGDINLWNIFDEKEYSSTEEDSKVDDNIDIEHIEQTDLSQEKSETMPRHIKLITIIVRRILQVLSHKNTHNRILILQILVEALLILHDVNDDWLLPVVHDIWTPLVNRFRYDRKEVLLVARCFELLCIMIATAKDFLRSRTLQDILPVINKFLCDSAHESVLKDKNSVYRMSQQYKLQRIFLNNLGYVAIQADLQENELHSILSAVSLYLSSRQPLPLQNATVTLFKTIQNVHPDVVRMYLLSMWPSIKTFTPRSNNNGSLKFHNISLKRTNTFAVNEYQQNLISLMEEAS